MRLVLAMSALLATTLIGGAAQAQYCDDCRNRDRPNAAQLMRERLMQSAPRERIPDRRPAMERPAVIKDRPADVAKVRGMNPKSAHNSLQGRTSPSDRKVPAAAKARPAAGKDLVVAHANKFGPHGGRVDTDAAAHGVPKQAKTAGLKLKVLEIIKPSNARPIISPAGAPSGCSNGGHCIQGDEKGATPSIDSTNERYEPKLVTKARGEKEELSKGNLSTVKPNSGPVTVPQGARKQQYTAPATPTRRVSEPAPFTRTESVKRQETGKD